jgi:hypothetical protein
MPHSYKADGPGGLTHVVLGVGIIMAVGLFTKFPQSFELVSGKPKGPTIIATQGDADASCAANTLETIVGTLGCAGTKRAAHLQRTTLVSATKKH